MAATCLRGSRTFGCRRLSTLRGLQHCGTPRPSPAQVSAAPHGHQSSHFTAAVNHGRTPCPREPRRLPQGNVRPRRRRALPHWMLTTSRSPSASEPATPGGFAGRPASRNRATLAQLTQQVDTHDLQHGRLQQRDELRRDSGGTECQGGLPMSDYRTGGATSGASVMERSRRQTLSTWAQACG